PIHPVQPPVATHSRRDLRAVVYSPVHFKWIVECEYDEVSPALRIRFAEAIPAPWVSHEVQSGRSIQPPQQLVTIPLASSFRPIAARSLSSSGHPAAFYAP